MTSPYDPSCPSFGWSVGLSKLPKGREVTLSCSYRRTFFKFCFVILWNIIIYAYILFCLGLRFLKWLLRSEKLYILENIRQQIYAKIGVRVTVSKQLWMPVLSFCRSLDIGANFGFVLSPKSVVKSSWRTICIFSNITISLIRMKPLDLIWIN